MNKSIFSVSLSWWLVLVEALAPLCGQTRVDAEFQLKNTKVGFGATLPAVCQTGQIFLLASPGSPSVLYGCDASGWQPQGVPSLPATNPPVTQVLTTDGSTASWVAAGGDASGSLSSLQVTALRQRPLSPDAPLAGQSLVWSGTEWKPTHVSGTSVTLKSGSTTLSNTGTINFQPSPGLLWGLVADTGQGAVIHAVLDQTVVATHASVRNNGASFCASPSGQTSSYTCGVTPALTAYQPGQLIYWRPAEAPTAGGVTLNIDGLGDRVLKAPDGVSDPLPEDFPAGQLAILWYDGAAFRQITASAGRLAGGNDRPVCSAAYRARWWHLPGGAGVTDQITVCAKNQADEYAWRIIN